MARKSVTLIGVHQGQLEMQANNILAGKQVIQVISHIVEYHQTVVAEPRNAVNPDNIPEFAFPSGAPTLFMITAVYN